MRRNHEDDRTLTARGVPSVAPRRRRLHLQALQERQRAEAQLTTTTEALSAAEDAARTLADRLRLSEEAVARLTATVAQLQAQLARAEDTDAALAAVRAELATTLQDKAAQEEDFAAREAQLRALNKTLKEEVRKLGRVPASGAPSMTTTADGGTAAASSAGPPRAAGAGSPASGGDVNLEYLKYCILKYMEFDDQRTAPLIKVIGLMLKFTPDELRRAQTRLAQRTGK